MDGGLEFDKIPREFGVEILMRRSRAAPTRAVCRVCIAGTRLLMSNLFAVDRTSLPTRIRIRSVSGTKG